jgi:predicted nucleotidyltransferase
MMIDLIEQHMSALAELCRRYHVRKLELFGSVASGTFDPGTSDLDFLVEFLPLNVGQHFDCYFGLLQALRELFGRNVDLVIPSAIRNPYLFAAVNQQRQVLYAA